MSGRKNRKAEDRVGERYGKLVVSSVERKNGRTYANCACDCGETLYSRIDALQSGATVSCGCFALEQTSLLNKSHGMWKSCTYQSWADMKSRCLNTKHASYGEYKERVICDNWLTFEGFFRDMGERPHNTTLDRIDNNVGYNKENCRWTTASYQAKNQKKRNSTTALSPYRGVGRDVRQKSGKVWFFSVTKNYITLRVCCHSELEAAASFDYCSKLLYTDSIELNNTGYILSDDEKATLNEKVKTKFKGESQ